jgi:chemotaxis receptor (MCP) glutamine deamidase CheD
MVLDYGFIFGEANYNPLPCCSKIHHERSTRHSEFEAKIFGGGNVVMLPEQHKSNLNVAEANIRFGMEQLREAGFKVKAEDVGGRRYRQVVFEMDCGSVWVKYGHCG